MTYFPDGSPYAYGLENADPSVLNVGWLGQESEFRPGAVSEVFLERLWFFCREPMRQSKGFHDCELCPKLPTAQRGGGLQVQRGAERLRLGSAEIRVVGQGAGLYAAPDLIYHYVVAHHYQPPEAFIQAVLASPLPNTAEYRARTSQWKYGAWLT